MKKNIIILLANILWCLEGGESCNILGCSYIILLCWFILCYCVGLYYVIVLYVKIETRMLGEL